jgi:hypothetical protein
MGEDHLLSVKAWRFHERYRRFHYRDIQAIVVTKAPRFFVSVPLFCLIALFAMGIPFAYIAARPYAFWVWPALLAMVALWVYVSAVDSCTCRLYTAVSREDLPSVYRTWTARKVLAQLEPRIAEVQGATPENWAEAVEDRTVGPRDPLLVELERQVGQVSGLTDQKAGQGPALPVSWIFLASLVGSGVAAIAGAAPWLLGLLFMGQTVTAVWVLIQCNRRQAPRGMRKVVIAALIFGVVILYAQIFTTSIITGMVQVRTHPGVVQPVPLQVFRLDSVVRQIYAGGCLLLSAATAALSIRK